MNSINARFIKVLFFNKWVETIELTYYYNTIVLLSGTFLPFNYPNPFKTHNRFYYF